MTEVKSKIQQKIKTICEFLFFDQYEDNVSFLRFEICFKPLFNNINISLEQVFKDICGKNKKYITYIRFANAYFNKDGDNYSQDTKIFFDKLFNSIYKKRKSFIEKVKENIYSFTTKRISAKRKFISMIQVLNDKNGKIHGINVRYDRVYKCNMYPKKIENDLDVGLEMNLWSIEEKSKIEQDKKKYKYFSPENYLDAVTHIFGTYNKESGYVTYIGFKCISGKTSFFGTPEGDGFLFGLFGNKLHDLRVQMTEEGITRLDPGFKPNCRKNVFLNKSTADLIYRNLNTSLDVIKDEDYFDKIEDKDAREKFLTTSIIKNDYHFIKRFKDRNFGSDYKEVVDQYPMNLLLRENINNDEYKEKEFEKLTLDDALTFYDKTYKKTKPKLFNLIYNQENDNNINKDNLEEYKKTQNNWKRFRKDFVMYGVKLLGKIGNIHKAYNVFEKKINVPLEEKIKLYEILEQNEKIFFFILNYKSNSNKEDKKKLIKKEKEEKVGEKDKVKEEKEKEEEKKENEKKENEKKEEQKKEEQKKEEHKKDNENTFLPKLSPEKTSIELSKKYIANLKELLLNKKLKKEDRKKLEKLLKLFILQKNILIENENIKTNKEFIDANGIDLEEIKKKEEEKRAKAKEEEEKIIEEEMNKKEKEFAEKKKTTIVNKSFIAKKVSTRIFHNQKMPKSIEPWTDETFPHEKESLCPYDKNGWILFDNLDNDDLEGWEDYEWCRIDDITYFEDYSVFEEGATIEDIKQGSINDCYFLSAIGSLCSYPLFFEKLFYIKERSEEHIYGIYLFLNGKWKLVLIDDYFPYTIANYEDKVLCFGSSIQEELWVSLLEKAWAKVNGSYARIGSCGFSYEAFDVLTEAYTEQIDIRIYKKDKREEELWVKLEQFFKKKYVLTAGTPNFEYSPNGLDPGHAYTLINIYTIETDIGKEKLVKLKNPFGNMEYKGDWDEDSGKWTDEILDICGCKNDDSENGIFYMAYEDFCKYFEEIDIAKLEPGYQTTYCKFKKNESIKCQVIQLKIEEQTNVYIQLYQKNPRIIRKNKTYYPKKVMCFLILVDSEFKYIKSAYGNIIHIAIETYLKPGTYYIFCDVNYRNENNKDNYGYMVTFYSEKIIKNFEKITDSKKDLMSKLEASMSHYCQKNIKPIEDKNGLKIFDSKHYKIEIPFRLFCFINNSKNTIKVKLNINQKNGKDFCIYNDRIASEFDNYVIKEIEPEKEGTILILEYNAKIEYTVDYEILNGNDIRTYDNTHQVFNKKGEKLDDKGYIMSYYSKDDNNKEFTIGLENTSNISFKMNLVLKDMYEIDRQLIGKDNIKFEIYPKTKKVFNARIKQNAKDPKFEFKKIK